VTVRGFAGLVQLAVAEVKAVALPGADQEAEANGASLVTCPDQAILFVVLEAGRLACLSCGIHRRLSEYASV
jgi:hypothetical protein